MSTQHRLFIIVLNFICLPINVWTMYRCWSRMASGGSYWGEIPLILLSLIGFVWCGAVVVLYTRVLLRSK